MQGMRSTASEGNWRTSLLARNKVEDRKNRSAGLVQKRNEEDTSKLLSSSRRAKNKYERICKLTKFLMDLISDQGGRTLDALNYNSPHLLDWYLKKIKFQPREARWQENHADFS
ncbi:unnamed protein product, partial [Mesorhabditis spiculigera]